jgi:uncharacterized protein (TIGR02145 family)
MTMRRLLTVVLIFLSTQISGQTVTDIDGNVYNTVTIGTQKWMKENLRVTHYRNGNLMPKVTDSIQWIYNTAGSYCYYNNDSINYGSIYGALYNWYAVMDTAGLCPDGWHICDSNEFTILVNFLGGPLLAGGKMKDTILWTIPNVGADNLSGFSAIPGGNRQHPFTSVEEGCYFWISSVYHGFSDTTACRVLLYNTAYVYQSYMPRFNGLSVRCICDTTVQSINEIDINAKVRIFPNPTSSSFSIQLPPTFGTLEKLEIFNSVGQMVGRYKTVDNIDISGYPNGLYFVVVRGESGERVIGRVVRE